MMTANRTINYFVDAVDLSPRPPCLCSVANPPPIAYAPGDGADSCARQASPFAEFPKKKLTGGEPSNDG